MRTLLSPTKFRQEIEVEMLGGGENFFPIHLIENAIDNTREALVFA